MKIFIVFWYNDEGDGGIDSVFSTINFALSRVAAMLNARPDLSWDIREETVDDLIN